MTLDSLNPRILNRGKHSFHNNSKTRGAQPNDFVTFPRYVRAKNPQNCCYYCMYRKFNMAAMKPEIVVFQLGQLFISACRPDSDAIPTATPMFSGSSNPKYLL